MTANVTFSLCAGAVSLAIAVLAGLKSDWAVLAVYLLLFAGFLARAAFGLRRAPERPQPPAPGAPAHPQERRLRPPRFRRR